MGRVSDTSRFPSADRPSFEDWFVAYRIRRPDSSAADVMSAAASPLRDSVGISPTSLGSVLRRYCDARVTVAEGLRRP